MSSPNKWMVGFRFRSEVRGVVEHFYLVDGTAGSAGAHRAAARMAVPASERAGRLEVQRVQIQRVVTDLLGHVGLSAPVPGVGAMPAAGSLMSPIEVAR
ncbi:hypothetical protein ACIOTI_36170 [Streptomyces sp. NPDC087843]|uniref:hypothetical protein n=1 Tax=Streptomyces sp. NPDC087843 TaxID=3365804 RepID=UPI0038128340